MRILILTTRSSWFWPHAEVLTAVLIEQGYQATLVSDHRLVSDSFDIAFLLSYFRLVDEPFLRRQRHNLVIHESALPHGKGWAPLFWQVLEGKNEIPFTLFEVQAGVDDGPIYMQALLRLQGYELHDEIRGRQADLTVALCLSFLRAYPEVYATPQVGHETHYRRRTPQDSALDPNQSLAAQFDVLRIVSNTDYPAFFDWRGHRYILKIEPYPEEVPLTISQDASRPVRQ